MGIEDKRYYPQSILTLLVAVALEPRTTGTLVTCTDR